MGSRRSHPLIDSEVSAKAQAEFIARTDRIDRALIELSEKRRDNPDEAEFADALAGDSNWVKRAMKELG